MVTRQRSADFSFLRLGFLRIPLAVALPCKTTIAFVSKLISGWGSFGHFV